MQVLNKKLHKKMHKKRAEYESMNSMKLESYQKEFSKI